MAPKNKFQNKLKKQPKMNNLLKANKKIKHKIETQEISLKHTKKNNHKEKKTQKTSKKTNKTRFE